MASSTDGKKFRFSDLSTDIKALIIDKLLRPSDLKNVCLVNKELHELAVKPLYRTVPLDIGSPHDHRLSAFLNPRNIGLQHIRQLRLYLARLPRDNDADMQVQQANIIAKMIFEFLPRDTLEEFRCADLTSDQTWCPWKKFSTDTLLLLYRTQRKMKWLEVMDLDRDILPELQKNEGLTRDLFQHTRRLALYPENRESLRLGAFYVEKTAEVLEDLNVHTSFPEIDLRDPLPTDVIEARELNDSATGPGLLTRTIFGHMMPFEKCEPLKNLTSLRLQRVNLRYCADSWCKVTDFTRIEVLRVLQCPGADALFAEMSKARSLPKHLHCLEFHHKDNDDNEALLALDGFLCLVSGLSELILDLERVAALPAPAGITRHAKTLTLLSIHALRDAPLTPPDDQEELVYPIDDFTKICSSTPNLVQLSTAWPPTSLIRAPTDDWKAFERALPLTLTTVQISTFPTNKPSSTYLPRPIYETLLQNLATRLFDARPSPLRLVAFGTSDRVYEREESKCLSLYLRSSCQTAEGKQRVYAAPIGWCLRQYVEPRSEVVDVVVHREVRGPPCREGRGDGSGLRWGGPGAGEGEEEYVFHDPFVD